MAAHPRRLHIAVVALSLLLPGIPLSADARQPGGPEPQVLAPDDIMLVRAAMEAVRAWRVTPAHANGAPLSTVVVLQVSFTPAR